MKWMIATDSSCDLMTLDTGSPEIDFGTVPFSLILDDQEYQDNDALRVPELVDKMESAASSHSACPSPSDWEELFLQADQVIAFTISGQLSGSYNSAQTGKTMALEKDPDKKIEIIDSRATGPKLVLLVQRALRAIQGGASFEDVCSVCRKLADNGRTVFTLSSFHNLIQNGRVNKFAGVLAGKLGIRVIGVGSPEGEIQLKDLIRGEQRTLKRVVKDMVENGYNGSEMAISHCLNESMALSLREMILAHWADAKVQILPTRGLDSYYAERSGLIVCYPTAAV